MKLSSCNIIIAIAALQAGVLVAVDGAGTTEAPSCYGCTTVETYTTETPSSYTYTSTYATECTTEVPVYETPTVTVTETSVHTKPGETVETTEYITKTTTLPPQTVTTTSKYYTTTTDIGTTTVYKKITYTSLITKTDTTTTTATDYETQTSYVDRPTTIVSYYTITEDGTTKTVPTTYTATERITGYVPSPTTEYVDRPTTIVNSYVVTQNGTTQIIYSTITDRETYISETTATATFISTSLITLPASTVTRDGTTVTLPPQTITSTITQQEPYTVTDEETVTADRPVPTTVFQTFISGYTSLVTLPTYRELVTVISGTTITLTTDRVVPTTIIQPASTFTTTLTLPGATFATTITQSGTTSVSTVTLPGNTSVQVITQPGTTLISTVTVSGPTVIVPGQTIISTQNASPPEIVTPPPQTVTVGAPPTTITAAPPPPVCLETGLVAVSDSAGCEGRSCQIEFQEGAAVHWSEYPDSPPLRTELVFVNSALRQTCITTSCNTDVFNRYYRQSLTACARPPCPSNTINCDCSIVVGPIVLPDGHTTSVVQVGPSGWNLNLGPTATANDVGLCSAGGPQCVTSTSRTLPTPIIYTGEVFPGNATNGAAPTDYLLPGIGPYFPAGDAFGACPTVYLNSVAYGQGLRARQAGPDSKVIIWSGAAQLLVRGNTQYVGASAVLAPTESASSPAAAPAMTTADTPATPAVSPSSPTLEPQGPSDTSVNIPPSAASSPVAVPTSTTAGIATDSQTGAAPPSQPGSSASEPVASLPGPTSASSPSMVNFGSETTAFTMPGSTGTPISGTFYITDTVYYSMLNAPDQQSIIDAVSSLRDGAGAVASQDFGQYVSSILGLNGTSGPPEATATGTAAGMMQIPRGLATTFFLLVLGVSLL